MLEEPRDQWEQRYLDGDTPWDKGAPAPPLEQFLQFHPVEGQVLVPGCGIGHDVRLLARHGADATGLDISPTAIHRAWMHPRESDETYVCGDFFCLPTILEGTFDWVVEHTCFCAIDPEDRPAYVEAVLEALKPEGHFLGIFFMNPDAEAGPPFGVEIEELDQLFERRFELLEERVPDAAYPGRENRERIRHYQLRTPTP
jgi:SAM-dependent methyltransferase